MLGNIEKKLQKVMADNNLEDVNIIITRYARHFFVQVALHRNKNLALPLIGSGEDVDKALESALKLLVRVTELEKERGVPVTRPLDDDAAVEGGYCAKNICDDRHVRFKRKHGCYYIVELYRMDADGFIVLNEPVPVTDDLKLVEPLGDGTQLYSWDDMGPLSGTSGEAIVKDGMVIKTRMTAIS